MSKREQGLIVTAERLASMEGSPEGIGFFRSCLGTNLYLRGRWAAARENLEAAYTLMESRRAGRQSNAQVFSAWALMFMGEYRELANRYPRLLADAQARGDLHTAVQLHDGFLAVLWLAADDPDTARSHIRESLAQWSRERFLLQHWHAMCGETDIELYLGNGEQAYARCARDLLAAEKSLLLKCQNPRVVTMFMQGRCAVASAGAGHPQRRRRLAEACRMVRRLEREVHVCAPLYAALVSAAASNVRGDRTEVIASLRVAIEQAEAADMAMHAAVARYRVGCLLGDEEGRALRQMGEEAMKAQGVREPERFARIWLPGRWGLQESEPV